MNTAQAGAPQAPATDGTVVVADSITRRYGEGE